MNWSNRKLNEMVSRLKIKHFWPWDYCEEIPIRIWLFAVAHDEQTLFWRIFGFEISWWRLPLNKQEE